MFGPGTELKSPPKKRRPYAGIPLDVTRASILRGVRELEATGVRITLNAVLKLPYVRGDWKKLKPIWLALIAEGLIEEAEKPERLRADFTTQPKHLRVSPGPAKEQSKPARHTEVIEYMKAWKRVRGTTYPQVELISNASSPAYP